MRVVNFLILLLAALLSGCAAGRLNDSAVTIAASSEPRIIHAASADPLGRQLHDTSHAMNPALLEQLRQRIVAYREATDQDIMRGMHMMGPNYTRYISDPELYGKTGVLILTHGFSEHGDRILGERVSELAAGQPTAMAMGMSMMTSDHLQLALNNLAAAGAEDIVVVPAVSTRFNSLLRQWHYIFGLLDDPAYAAVPRVMPPARLHLVWPLEDHYLVGDVLLQYAAEISSNPTREEVIIVAHGPEDQADNEKQLAVLGRLAEYLDERTDYAAVSAITLQDDAPPGVRAANVKALRARVSAAADAGREVLVITSLLGTRTVQSSLRRDLRGLDYRFNARGLIQHENFIRWIELSVADALSGID